MAKKSKKRSTRRSISKTEEAQLLLRPLQPGDYEALARLQRACFPIMGPWTPDQFQEQVKRFPEGQLGIFFDGQLVGSAATLILRRANLSVQHSFDEVSGDGYLTDHDPEGDTLYGIDICVDPSFRGKKLARRLYDARKDIARERNLQAMIIAGRMPNYARHAERLSPEEYVELVQQRKIRDPVVTAQTANGFRISGVIRNYLPADRDSGGHAVLMEWTNTDYVARRPGRQRIIDDVRVSAVQYQMRPVAHFDEFARQCEFFVDTASEYRCDFVCFPELLTNQLLSLVEPDERPAQMARRLSQYTDDYRQLFTGLSMNYNINIIGGSHLQVGEDDQLYNEAYLFRRDGSWARQRKLHITPAEAQWWGVTPGDGLEVFDTDCGPIAILICYDVEFPELGRIARGAGARLFFVPFNTDIRPAYLRVRTCAHARCVENNVYAVLAGPVGNLPEVEGTDIHYAQACILTPCDIPFSRDGIGSEATPNVETMLIHEVDMSLLRYTLHEGAVRTWLDRRHDLYRVSYRGEAIGPG